MNGEVTINQIIYYLNPDGGLVTLDSYLILPLDMKKMCRPIWNYAEIR